MGRPARSSPDAVTRRFTRHASISLPQDLFEAVKAHAIHYDMSQQDAMRELMGLGAAMDPTKFITQSERRRAYLQSRQWVLTRVNESLNEIVSESQEYLGKVI